MTKEEILTYAYKPARVEIYGRYYYGYVLAQDADNDLWMVTIFNSEPKANCLRTDASCLRIDSEKIKSIQQVKLVSKATKQEIIDFMHELMDPYKISLLPEPQRSRPRQEYSIQLILD